ncbi:hypothetical protein [Aeromonas veronii]|uniref:hypothetical protein n=1 Tax=Aeromonas veronii TaxID=654 RepID=UPI003D1E9B99
MTRLTVSINAMVANLISMVNLKDVNYFFSENYGHLFISKLQKYKNNKNNVRCCFYWLFLILITTATRRKNIIKTHGKHEIPFKNMVLQIFSPAYLLAKTAK